MTSPNKLLLAAAARQLSMEALSGSLQHQARIHISRRELLAGLGRVEGEHLHFISTGIKELVNRSAKPLSSSPEQVIVVGARLNFCSD